MYNPQFLDTIDKVNSIAKAIGFTNGVTWARKQLEDGNINEYTFEIFSSCHDLRNLMAHGYAVDINISAATMQKAQLFLKAISNPLANNNAIILNSSGKLNPTAHLEVQVGDYVIIMTKSYYSYNTPTGILFRVVEVNRATAILENLNTKNMYDINRLRNDSSLDLLNGLYVFKNNPLGVSFGNNMQLTVVNRPYLDKGIKGSPFISFQYTTHNSGTQYNNSDIKKATCKGYVAHIDCFEPYKGKQFLDFTNGDVESYLGIRSPYCEEYEDDGLPF
jgi:hypothetical protein